MMNIKKTLLLILVASVLAACGGKDPNVEVAVIVALTQTAAAQQIPPAPTSAPEVSAAEYYQPYNAADCTALHDSLAASIGFPGVVAAPVPFEDFILKQSGSGCQIAFSATGLAVAGLGALTNPAAETMHALGWADDMNYGASGPGAMGYAFRKEGHLCMASFKTEEIDPALCPGNEPVSACWSRLAPEQMKYSATFNCATHSP